MYYHVYLLLNLILIINDTYVMIKELLILRIQDYVMKNQLYPIFSFLHNLKHMLNLINKMNNLKYYLLKNNDMPLFDNRYMMMMMMMMVFLDLSTLIMLSSL